METVSTLCDFSSGVSIRSTFRLSPDNRKVFSFGLKAKEIFDFITSEGFLESANLENSTVFCGKIEFPRKTYVISKGSLIILNSLSEMFHVYRDNIVNELLFILCPPTLYKTTKTHTNSHKLTQTHTSALPVVLLYFTHF